tara:strand:- start:3155 stop:3340 length:186 start_codon:yes stop_codon:yes gene_type:complete
MVKGTPSMGKKSGKQNFRRCPRCGRKSMHLRKKKCSSCGFGNSSKLRKYSWQKQRTKRKNI